ncbi:hypothetical protein Glove_31g2 [Diversispora epigaea]|uniref:Uncharacterized protein n=1 Tax=Diversispora epigaea TaxID=1348612 RepID=A0A397JS15_9GLOM|nr:hypothetical protein Glove_31g2 [Diversispora epigaea]
MDFDLKQRGRLELEFEFESEILLVTKIDSLDKKIDSLLKEQIDIKKRLKNIELLSEINNDLNFSKNVITRVTTNVFKVNIFPPEKNLKEETESVIRKSFPDIYESMDSRLYLHAKLFWSPEIAILGKKVEILLEKLRGMRGGITSWVKSVIFEIFGESQLPRIDFQSSPAEINSWKSDQRIKDAYHNLFKEEEERSSKRRRTSGGHVLSPQLGSPRLDSSSPRLASSRLVSPRLASSRLASFQPVSPQPVSSRLFESPDTSDTTREEGDTTGSDTEGAEIVGQ